MTPQRTTCKVCGAFLIETEFYYGLCARCVEPKELERVAKHLGLTEEDYKNERIAPGPESTISSINARCAELEAEVVAQGAALINITAERNAALEELAHRPDPALRVALEHARDAMSAAIRAGGDPDEDWDDPAGLLQDSIMEIDPLIEALSASLTGESEVTRDRDLRALEAFAKEVSSVRPTQQQQDIASVVLAEEMNATDSEAKKDGERLDWTPSGFMFIKYDPIRPDYRWTLMFGNERVGDYDSFREAIDAARSRGEGRSGATGVALTPPANHDAQSTSSPQPATKPAATEGGNAS